MPTPLRIRFVVGSIVVWAIVAVLVRMGEKVGGGIWVIWVLAAILFALGGLRLWERFLRKAHLPAYGQTPWCFRTSVAFCVMAAALAWIGTEFGQWVPGFQEKNFDGGWKTGCWEVVGGKHSSTTIPLSFSGRSVSAGWSRATGRPQPTFVGEQMRFYPWGQPEAIGWTLRSGDKVLRREDGGRTEPWTSEGLIKVIEEITGLQVPEGSKEYLAGSYGAMVSAWDPHFRLPALVTAPGPATTGGASHAGSSTEWGRPRPWISTASCVLGLAVIGLGIGYVARATMGNDREIES